MRRCRGITDRHHKPRAIRPFTIRLGVLVPFFLLMTACPGLALPPAGPTLELVPGDSTSGGPTYDLAIGRFEITNTQFAEFLNDALNDLTGPGGQFLYHDLDSGDVYISARTDGLSEVGTNGAGPPVYVASTNSGRVVFSADRYVVTPGFEDHPVVGVSWYGAVKYCNWLTLRAGFAADQRAYTEAASTNLDGWHPVTIAEADWKVRDLNDAERQALNRRVGFRLPTDQGQGIQSAFNEWYKAAAWDPQAGLHQTYGFGRSTLAGADANFWTSGDPFDNDTTPVGFFDGVTLLADGQTITSDTSNAYNLYDLSGNVWEWVQDHGTTVARRGVRGGSWFSVAGSLSADTRADRNATSTSATTGFRVVQSRPGRLLGVLLVQPDAGLVASGPYGGSYDTPSTDFTLTNLGTTALPIRVEPDLALAPLDMAGFGQCLSGPGATAAVGCAAHDLTGDGPVDLHDFIRVQRIFGSPPQPDPAGFAGCMSGPGITIGPGCAAHDLLKDGSVDVADFARLQLGMGRSWVTVNGAPWLEQVLAPQGGSVTATVAIDVDCGEAVVLGNNATSVTLTNLTDGSAIHEPVSVTLTEPLSVVSTNGLVSAGPLGGPFASPQVVYTLTSTSASPVSWRVAVDQPWVTLNGTQKGAAVTGVLDPTQASIPVTVGLDASASDLQAGVHTASVKIIDECTGQLFVRPIRLEVDTLGVSPVGDADFSVVSGGLFNPADMIYTLSSLSDVNLAWEVSADGDPSWLLIGGATKAAGTLAPSGTVDVAIQPSSQALGLEPGAYSATLRFTNLSQPNLVVETTRQVTLTVPGTVVAPMTDLISAGAVGGPFTPAQQVYTITHDGVGELPWQANYTTTPPGGDWLDLNGASTAAGVIVEPGPAGAVSVAASVNASADALAPGTYAATIVFDLTGTTAARTVYLQVGEISLDMVTVPGAGGDQPGGPTYDYRIGTDEITNEQYAGFLNDALLHLTDERGQYLYHDTDSGDVYLNTAIIGAIGTDGAGTKLFDATVNGHTTHNGTLYAVDAGFENHPVTGVSWYGAAKFCNWLTLLKRMGPADRVYAEGPAPLDWQGTASGLTVAVQPGYRLAMDDGLATASPFNEWYKAAAWLPDVSTNALYGFGRSALAVEDANTLNSGDPFESDVPPTSPVGFYDGANLLADATTVTVDTGNGYGLYDMCGNAAEWVHDVGSTAGSRATRGGSALNGAASSFLRADGRGEDSAGATRSFIGFRVVQSVMAQPLTVPERSNFLAAGLFGGPITPLERVYTVTLPPSALGSREWTVSSDSSWVQVDGRSSVSGVVGPGEAVPVRVSMGSGASTLPALPGPSISTVLVPGSDVQPAGPAHDYRIAIFETTNAQFAQFLNDALANPGNERGYYLFHDTDTGDVYINTNQTGDVGTNGAGAKLFDAAVNGRISYSGGVYDVQAGFENDPVAGVSWYGALKYCNWLSLSEGVDVNQLAYSEGTTPGAWHPANISDADWALRDLTAVERQELVDNYCGYRLPMDDGAAVGAAYNEWYKAAAFLPEVGTSGINAVYGFGRDVLAGADANYAGSGDDRDDAVTPVGFYDGINLLADGVTVTRDTASGYGLYDASGNVAEWVQDWGTDGAGRGLRGGGFFDALSSPALTAMGREWADAAGAFDDVGFRVVQSKRAHTATLSFTDHHTGTVITRQVILSLSEPIDVVPENGLTSAGPFLGPFAPASVTYTVTNRSATAMDWQVQLQLVGAQWLDLDVNTNGSVPGRLEAGEWVDMTLTVNATADTLVPGAYLATMTLTNLTSGATFVRQVDLTVGDALAVSPTEDLTSAGQWLGPFSPLVDGQVPPQVVTDFALTNLLAGPLNYTVSANANWLTLNGGAPATGTLAGAGQGGDAANVPVDINTNADTLAVGQHTAVLTFAYDDAGASGQLTRTVRLTVDDPLEIVGTGGITLLYEPPTDPAVLPTTTYTITNRAQIPVAWQVDVTTNPVGGTWLKLNGAAMDSGELLPGAWVDVVASFSADVAQLLEGDYTATITFKDLVTGVSQTRLVTLTVDETLNVLPYTGLDAFGSLDNPVLTPGQVTYTLTNRTVAPLDWQVLVDRTWLTADLTAGTLLVGQNTPVTLTLENPYTGPVTDSAQISFVDVTGGNVTVATRTVSVTLTQPFADGASVPANDGQPNGPVYAFEIGTLEVTNAQFAAFLDDALLNPTTERGQYMYHDTDSGDVFVNDTVTGASGTTGSDTLSVKMFSASINDGRIAFDGVGYTVLPGTEDHPVVGVSWYGALKYCNWLTLAQGVGLSERCYVEGTDGDLSAWRPVTIAQADWQVRDLNDTERQALIATYRGFRLPMDDGSDNASPFFDSADAFNEWYQAAAWDALAGTNHLYGFGRDTFVQADANYFGSGDPFELDALPVSPVGFFDGLNLLGDALTVTADTANAYGLYDMSGNVAEWVQDRYSTFGTRALRGGSWENFQAQGVWMRTFDRDFANPTLTWKSIGFRVMRVAVTPSAR
ncbi:MAG: SUMF1/EgtB/PvdO family nonheme iron enzyme [Phycisphaerae bacterium]